MISKRHLVFNIALILFPWLSVLFLGTRNLKRYSMAGLVIVFIELLSQMIGQSRKWWVFFDKPNAFIKDVLPFSLGPYMPMCMWLLKLSGGNFKKFLILNAVADGLFAYPGVWLLKKLKIAKLFRLSSFQFFIYLFHKAFILFGAQYYIENRKGKKS